MKDKVQWEGEYHNRLSRQQGDNILAARIRKIKRYGKIYRVGSTNNVSDQELIDMLYYTRRFIGYVVYPRWTSVRILLSEVIEITKRNGIYKHKLKQALKEAITEIERLENAHMEDFDRDFIEVLGGAVTAKALSKMNEARGALGAMMMHQGVKNYVLYSHPYNFMNLCYDNTIVYDRALNAVADRFNVDFSDVFRELRGDKAYNASLKVLDEYIRAVREPIPHLKWDNSLALTKLNELEKITLSDVTVKNAIFEAYNELPEEKKPFMQHVLDAWSEIPDENEENAKDDITSKLAEKYNVIKSKK